MRLIQPKTKKFWSPALITQPGGKFTASLTATYINQFDTSNVTSGTVTTFDFSLTLPNIPAGSLLVAALHTDSFTLTGITFDPAGQNISMTSRGAATRPILCDCVLSSGVSAGTYVFRATISGGTWQFRRGGLVAWYLQGQTVNSPENIQAQSGSAVTAFSVTAGRVMLSSAKWSGTQTMTWSLSTVVPSSSHGSGTTLGAAEWQSNITTTASYTVSSTAGSPQDGQVAATYV